MTTQAPHRRASLADVAKLAGVSSQTVSRVVRGEGAVAEDTRTRVMAAVEVLNYRPNLAARSLSRRRTGVIHILNATPLFLSHGHARTFLFLVGALGELGFQTSTSQATFDADLSWDQHIPLGVDGVVLLGGHSRSQRWAEVAHAQVPVTFVGQRIGLPDSVASVSIDHRYGSWLATSHLIEGGARNLVHICGPKDWLDAQERRDGFIEACADLGLNYTKLSSPTWDASYGYRLAAQIPDDVDGVFASNDHLALGVLRRMHERGRAVPGDVSVVGFDDSDGSDCSWPPLTTVRQPFERVARAAVAQLGNLMEGGEPEHTLLKPELIVRSSSKGPQ